MLISQAYAQSVPATAMGSDPLTSFLVPMAIVFTIFYFFVIRPQNKRLQAQRTRLEAVKRGDEVVTGGGIVGKVVHIREDKLEVEIAPNVRIKVLKGTITDILTKPEPVTVNQS